MEGFDGFVKIYVLTDKNKTPFYVGCTAQELLLRRSGHITEARKNHKYTNAIKNEKIRSLDFKIRIKLLFLIHVKADNMGLAQRSCCLLERYWIERLLMAGYELCNGNGLKGIRILREQIKIINEKECQNLKNQQ